MCNCSIDIVAWKFPNIPYKGSKFFTVALSVPGWALSGLEQSLSGFKLSQEWRSLFFIGVAHNEAPLVDDHRDSIVCAR